ncbi:MAG: hypothetical protein IJ710_05710 [Prevotella sp.]|nr:hypothetical protein [Prevotella sp.]
MDVYNIIAIGGTGMRCAESLVHLCAMGMFDDTQVNLLALDTDCKNGNFERLQKLVKNYQSITADRDGVASDTLFSAKINYFEFSPDYGRGTTFDTASNYSDAKSAVHDAEGVKWRESELADLFLTKKMRGMDLQHGYRAQTQMGSMLMYHAVIEEAYKAKVGKTKDSGLAKFVENLMNNPGSKVFLFGSIFGGTGASSIPILPRALQRAAQILSRNGEGDVLSKNLFGTVMLTNYFSFDSPKNQGDVVATSDKFALNSQAALFFYHNDKTVRHTYKRLYLIGRDKPRNVTKTADQSLTGGAGQCNQEDYIELLAASAAYDFFKAAKQHQQKSLFGPEGETFYRTLSSDETDSLTFEAFFGEDKDKFAEKCGIMMASAFLYGPQNFAENRRRHETFKSLTKEDVDNLRKFFRAFYDLERLEENPGSGWIKQMQESAADMGYQGFLFHPDVYTTNPRSAADYKYNAKLFPEGSRFKYEVSIVSNAFSKFKDEFGKQDKVQGMQNTVSNLLKRTYTTFHDLYGF